MHAAWHTIWFWLLIIAFILLIVAIILDVAVYRNFTAPWWIWLMIGIALLLAVIALVCYLCCNHSGVTRERVIIVETQSSNGVNTVEIIRPDTPVSKYPAGYRALLGVEDNGVAY